MIETEFRKLNTSDEKAYQTFIGEFVSANEKIIPSSIDPKGMAFVDWLDKSEKEALGLDLPEDRVPADSYFLIRKADGKILGAINIRHRLNDHLQKRGGHIGYGVAPSERRKGYAGLMLKQALVICRDQLKIDRILITCDKDNIGSNKTIIKSGGILENEARDDKDNIFCRYWIKL